MEVGTSGQGLSGIFCEPALHRIETLRSFSQHHPPPSQTSHPHTVLYFAIGSVFLPGHAAWCTLLLWVAANIGAFVAFQLRLPRVIGMLCAGLLMQNLPWSAVDAFPKRWGIQMRAAALATIFLRCGLELDLAVSARLWVVCHAGSS